MPTPWRPGPWRPAHSPSWRATAKSGGRCQWPAGRAWTSFSPARPATGAAPIWRLFADSPTERGRRHLEALTLLRRRRSRAVLLYLVQRADCDRVAPAETIDPAYADALRTAVRAGVEIFALGARVTARAITVERRLPVVM